MICLYDPVSSREGYYRSQGKVAIMPEVLGLDVGGANLKAATSTGEAVTLPFPLWKQPDKLTGGILELLVRLPHRGPIALTMTGELCDCFLGKSAGVRHIVQSVQQALPDQPIFVWRNDGKWASTNHSLEDPLPVAAANWLASATFAGRYLKQGPGWFFDLGSTTLDMIPLLDGKVISPCKTDLDRLLASELAYLGASRTPVCHLLQEVEIGNQTAGVAAEFFATFDDARIVLDHVQEDKLDKNTADGQPRTKEHAQARLARMICSDVEELGEQHIQSIADQIYAVFCQKLLSHLRSVHTRSTHQRANRWGGVILAGSGEGMLAEQLAQLDDNVNPVVSMTGRVGPELSTALAAYAVAVLLSERQSR